MLQVPPCGKIGVARGKAQKGNGIWRKFPHVEVAIGISRFTPPQEAGCTFQNICHFARYYVSTPYISPNFGPTTPFLSFGVTKSAFWYNHYVSRQFPRPTSPRQYLARFPHPASPRPTSPPISPPCFSPNFHRNTCRQEPKVFLVWPLYIPPISPPYISPPISPLISPPCTSPNFRQFPQKYL